MSNGSNERAVISVENLWKRFGDVVAVRDISFRVHKGEVLGFLGPNGAGKSTTMKILTCFIPSDDGRASIAGFDVRDDSLEVRKRIGYLPESAPLYHDMEITEYLRFVGQMRKIEASKIQSRIDDVISICGLNTMVGRLIGQLSKGYRQRVGLAQTMLHDPDILVMDEPTVGLDPNQIVEIRGLIKKIGKEKTVILSTHILPEVEATCDRVVIINQGELVADGTTQELIGKARGQSEKVTCKIRGDRAAIEQRLKEIPTVSSLSFKGEELNQLNSFEISPSDQGDPREEIFFAVAKGGWSMTELKREGVRLEDVFAQLTQREA